jgi:transglutaminase-like putative cysteine protease
MKNNRTLITLLLYAFGFMLLWEWLLPLEQVTQTTQVHYFLLFVLLSILFSFLHAPLWIGWPVKSAFIIASLYLIFREANESIFIWLVQFGADIQQNMERIALRHWIDLSPGFRSLLFFLLLWQIVYLLRFWLTVRRKIFVFYVMTVFYVTLLDTFTEYEANRAIVRIVIVGFALLGILFFQRVLEKERMGGQAGLMKKWAIPLAVMIGISVLAGFVSPKAGPVWPDPVPFIESKAGRAGNSGLSKIGYGPDDSRLGGPFMSDDRVVFEVAAPGRQYWKIETKDVYTGKGWVASDQAFSPVQFQFGETFLTDEYRRREGKLSKAVFRFEISYPHLVRPYGFRTAATDDTEGFLQYDPVLDKISSYKYDGREVRLREYTVTYEEASYSMKELRGTTGLPDGEQYDRILEKYTQLPESFPERVRDLALDITKDEDNWFDKARAIEQYFQSGEFAYDQTKVAIPTGDEDYVEQFLFDTKRGYCDNFSTSMVTMLRSIGIPARWAKGYAPGNYRGMGDGKSRIYEVTNNEAHSWVEIFFPALGWVPFEPTKGFSNPSSYIYDEGQGSPDHADSAAAAEKDEKKEEKKKKQNIKEEKEQDKAQTLSGGRRFPWKWGASLLLAVSAAVLAMVFYRRKKHLLPVAQKNADDVPFTDAYELLLHRLDRCGLKRKTGQTLREYAAMVDSQFQSDEMSTLTERYERILYRGDDASFPSGREKELWNKLMDKTGLLKRKY